MKRLVDEDTCHAVADAVTASERTTRAQLVAVLAPASAGYGEYALLWSAAVSLLATMSVLLTANEWGTSAWLHRLPWLVPALFLVLALLFRLPPVLRLLVPGHVQHRHAAAMARVQFLAQRLHHTREHTGLLIFVSEFEHYVEIIVDRGVAQHVPDSAWTELVAAFTRRVSAGEVRTGFLETIAGCGKLLAEKLPAGADNPNELPNRLVILD